MRFREIFERPPLAKTPGAGLLRTGFIGAVSVVLNIIYIAAYCTYYLTSFPFLTPSVSSPLRVFTIWSVAKPALTLIAVYFSVNNVTSSGLTSLFTVLAVGVWVGTAGQGAFLIYDWIGCNSKGNGFSNLCSDPLYCCIYYDDVPGCSGLGPCISPPTSASELGVSSDFIMLGLIVLICFVLELLLVFILFGVSRVRARVFRRMRPRDLQYLRTVYGAGDPRYPIGNEIDGRLNDNKPDITGYRGVRENKTGIIGPGGASCENATPYTNEEEEEEEERGEYYNDDRYNEQETSRFLRVIQWLDEMISSAIYVIYMGADLKVPRVIDKHDHYYLKDYVEEMYCLFLEQAKKYDGHDVDHVVDEMTRGIERRYGTEEETPLDQWFTWWLDDTVYR